MKKTVISIAMVVLMLVAFAVPALAGPVDDVYAELDNVAAKFSGNAGVSKMVEDAKEWIGKNEDLITAEVATTVSSEIGKALGTVGGAKHVSELSQAQINSVIGNVEAALSPLGLTLAIDGIGSSTWTFVVLDADLNAVAGPASANLGGGGVNPIKQTGLDVTAIVMLIIGVTVLFGAGIVVALYTRKRKQPEAV